MMSTEAITDVGDDWWRAPMYTRGADDEAERRSRALDATRNEGYLVARALQSNAIMVGVQGWVVADELGSGLKGLRDFFIGHSATFHRLKLQQPLFLCENDGLVYRRGKKGDFRIAEIHKRQTAEGIERVYGAIRKLRRSTY